MSKLVAVACVPLFAAACVHSPAPAVTAPVGWETAVGDRLFFGRNIPAGGSVSDSAWSVFLTEVVTPRLPSGFSVYRGEGQWRGENGAIVREAGFVLEVEYKKGEIPDQVFDEIANEYIRRFNQEAVLRVRAPAEQRLYRAKAR